MKKRKLLMFSVLPCILMLFSAEATIRFYYFYKHHYDIKYLFAPFLWKDKKVKVYKYRKDESYERYDKCSNRNIFFTINSEGGRGREWDLFKPKGSVRIIAVGGSTTFGTHNSDDQT